METSFISGKTLNELQQEKTKGMNETQVFEVKSMNNKRKGDNPEQRLKDSYEQVFMRRLNFLKSLLNEDSR